MPAKATPPIARIRLARSPPRLIALPLVLVATGVAAAAGALRADGPAAIGLAVGGSLLMLVAIAVGIVLLSIRLDVDDAGVRLHWLGGQRRYGLARGAVTRVTLRGRNASSLRPSLGAFGWAIGPAKLRKDEAIDVVRLAASPTAIVIPTARGRLAISVTDEQQLLDALGSAARARHRLDELARTAAPVKAIEPLPAPAAGPAELTGIERIRLAERMAAERAAALEGAEAERRAAAAAAEAGAEDAREAAGDAEPARTGTPETRAAAGRRVRIPLPGARAAAVIAPVLVAGALWNLILAAERLPELDGTRLRLLTTAFIIAGPGASIGAAIARIWWPRLVGLVSLTALFALALLARAVLLD